jgi:L-arabinose isomerase
MSVGREFGGQGDDLRSEIAFGMDCDSWMQGQIGRYLKQCADDEVAALKEELVIADASNVAHIEKLQMEIAVRRQVFYWMDQAIQKGLAAQTLALDRGAID